MAATKKKAAEKGAAKRKAAKTVRKSAAGAQWNRQGSEAGIRVRMYRVGFGDFFLVSFLSDRGDPVHVIVDCGVFKGTSQTGDLGSIELAVADMAKTTGGKVALIVVTHRHADHIAGFGRCASTFQSLAVQAIWMSIWESQYSTAPKFQAELTKTATALQAHFAALGANATQDEETARKFMENANGETGKGSNAKALNLLKNGIRGVSPSYYQAGQSPTLPPDLGRAGVGARILGPPPVADNHLMRLMDLQKGIGQYLTGASTDDGATIAPFGGDWEVTAQEGYDSSSFFEWFDNRSTIKEPSPDQAADARQRMEDALQQAQPDAATAAAAQLNSILNNQSLVILFTFKGKNLLFVGDAQAGNWEHWIFGTDNPEKTASGPMTSDAQTILTSLDFYKVGHHGSGNATPKPVVDAMGRGTQRFAAMCSTQDGVYGKENIKNPSAGTEVPRQPLMAALGAVSTLVRSDQLPITVNGETKKPMDEAPIPSVAGSARFESGALWVDCYL